MNVNFSDKPKPVFVLTGPTASGKSSLLYELSPNMPIEVIGADARQIYKQMEIGTASPNAEEIKMFPHHLFNFLAPTENFSAGEFVKKSKRLIEEIHQRNRIPIFVGGTFFYIKSLWDGLIQEPPIDEHAQKIIEFVETLKPQEIQERLKEKDFVSYQRISAADGYRLKRALTVSLIAQKPFSSFERSGGIYSAYNFQSFCLQQERTMLYEKINLRTEQMFASGFLDEIELLIKMGLHESVAMKKTIGYKEVLEKLYELCSCEEEKNSAQQLLFALKHLTKEQIGEVKTLIAQKTRNYAKRQLTWFRSENRLTFLSLENKKSFVKKLQENFKEHIENFN